MEAIAVGVELTGRIVTSAALLFAVAFGAFLNSRIVITRSSVWAPRPPC